ncbi:MAG: hypothetical protein KDD52_06210 [Bdellovibrionales bacterium]|nr:hypothetical protein [Bdellovibrionales bacterium]
MSLFFFLHIISNFTMLGVIWIIQLIHYPSFALVDPKLFASFHHKHTRRISYVVMPAMLMELFSGIALWVLTPQFVYKIYYGFILLCIGLIWGCTFFLSVPLHQKLERGFDETSIQKLVRTNWPRTILWSLKSVFLVYLWIEM